MTSLVYVETDRPNRCYSAGEQVTGVIRIQLSSAVRIRRLRVILKGQEKVQLAGLITDTHTFLEATDKPSKWSSGLLNAGTHSFPFSIQIPLSSGIQPVPGSFRMHNASIDYTIDAVVERPLFSQNIHAVEKRTILIRPTVTTAQSSTFDAPTMMRGRLEIPVDTTTHPGVRPFQGGIRVTLPRKRFFVGEEITAELEFIGDLDGFPVSELKHLEAQAEVSVRLCQQYVLKTLSKNESHRSVLAENTIPWPRITSTPISITVPINVSAQASILDSQTIQVVHSLEFVVRGGNGAIVKMDIILAYNPEREAAVMFEQLKELERIQSVNTKVDGYANIERSSSSSPPPAYSV